jgi:tRNA(Leu) C34 or U34 (ribose-2'-O)-methylase TrmL
MLNEGSPVTEFKKADLNKIKKLEEALAKLKSGEERYYVITKLSSIKSLCQNETVRQHYCWYLFDCVKRQLESKVVQAYRQTLNEQFVVSTLNPTVNMKAAEIT